MQQQRGRGQADERRQRLLPQRQVKESLEHDLDDELLQAGDEQSDADAQTNCRPQDSWQPTRRPE